MACLLQGVLTPASLSADMSSVEKVGLSATSGYAAFRMTQADVDALMAHAEGRDGMAAKRLADLYLVGIPALKASPEAALRWYEIALALGETSAARGASLARFQVEGHAVVQQGSRTLLEAKQVLEGHMAYADFKPAPLKALAIANVPEAQLLLGLMYADTGNPDFNIGSALDHLNAADLNGSARAAYRMGELMHQAAPALSSSAFIRAAERGHKQAARQVAAAFIVGNLPVPVEEGLKWLDVLAFQGDATAAEILERYRKANPALTLKASVEAARWRSRMPAPPSWDQ